MILPLVFAGQKTCELISTSHSCSCFYSDLENNFRICSTPSMHSNLKKKFRNKLARLRSTVLWKIHHERLLHALPPAAFLTNKPSQVVSQPQIGEFGQFPCHFRQACSFTLRNRSLLFLLRSSTGLSSLGAVDPASQPEAPLPL